MGVFGAFFGCRGDAGFKGPWLGVSSGVVGFNVAMLSRLVREKVRPAWSDGGCEREKVRPARSKHPKIGVFTFAGRVFRGRAAGGAVLGEFFRANWPCVDLGCDAVHFRLAAMGVLRHAKPSDGVSPACRRLGWRHSPPISGGEAALFDVRPAMSHVIPLRVFQALKACRWNCSVCGASRKMTMLNYVRLWGP